MLKTPVRMDVPSKTVVYRDMIADGVTPIGAYHCLTQARPGVSFLFESTPGPSRTSRYSIIGLGVCGEVRASGGEVTLSIGEQTTRYPRGGVLAAARQLMTALRPKAGDQTVYPFLGAYGAAAFELSAYFERLPELTRGKDPMPDLHLVVPQTLVVFDHFTHRVSVATLSDASNSTTDDADVLQTLSDAPIAPLSVVQENITPKTVIAAYPFVEAVAKAKEHIAAGNAFQIVLSQRWLARTAARPLDVYRSLRSINPSPYMFFLDLGWGQLLGSSPEILARLDGRRANVRPLAGTRPRSHDPELERKMASKLKRDPKERAEHVMLVDLGRNDLGRVCTEGSVRVSELMAVEYFSHVMHLVSEVFGELRPDCDAFDLFAAAFPAGTVSGAPKIRAMELIADLEGRRRGFYAGSVAHFGFDGSMHACITLRSAHAYGDAYHVQAGAGIVADSVPALEDLECRSKARAVLEALALASGR